MPRPCVLGAWAERAAKARLLSASLRRHEQVHSMSALLHRSIEDKKEEDEKEEEEEEVVVVVIVIVIVVILIVLL